uniref:Uncharacterized protein n=1 Tax=Kalanchoe fedtschenkoi TaxID=63787 RepID=A0A7N0UW65_KALFE
MEPKSISSTLHRRYSVGTPPSDLFLPKLSSFLPPYPLTDTPSSSDSAASALLSFPSVDLDLISLNSQSYTSLKDILPTTSAVNSPTTAAPPSSSNIPIRNRPVKQAAWAYRQPVAASPTFPFSHFLPPLNAFCRLFDCGLIPVLTRAFGHFHISTSSSHR